MKIDFDEVMAFFGCIISIGLIAIPAAVVVGIGVYQAIDSAGQSFVAKCVQAGATHKACFEVVNPPKETLK